jgi:hypothetical protein
MTPFDAVLVGYSITAALCSIGARPAERVVRRACLTGFSNDSSARILCGARPSSLLPSALFQDHGHPITLATSCTRRWCLTCPTTPPAVPRHRQPSHDTASRPTTPPAVPQHRQPSHNTASRPTTPPADPQHRQLIHGHHPEICSRGSVRTAISTAPNAPTRSSTSVIDCQLVTRRRDGGW